MDVDELVLGIGEYPGRVEALDLMYCLGTAREKDLSPAEVAQRVAQNPDAFHLVWQLGMNAGDPYDLPDLVESLPTRTVMKPQRQLMALAVTENTLRFEVPSEIVAEMEQYPQARHKVWPQLAERWYDPWDVEEFTALALQSPVILMIICGIFGWVISITKTRQQTKSLWR